MYDISIYGKCIYVIHIIHTICIIYIHYILNIIHYTLHIKYYTLYIRKYNTYITNIYFHECIDLNIIQWLVNVYDNIWKLYDCRQYEFGHINSNQP
jgi:hypothetical protein